MHLKEEEERKDIHMHDLRVSESSKLLCVTIATGPGNKPSPARSDQLSAYLSVVFCYVYQIGNNTGFFIWLDVLLNNLANMAEPEEELQRDDGGSTKKVEKLNRRKKEKRGEAEPQELEEEKRRCL